MSVAGGRVILRPARREESGLLAALALRSKATWGYPESFLAACREELTWSPDAIDGGTLRFVVAEAAGQVVGFHAVSLFDGAIAELEALFVEPDWIGRGVGRALLADACRIAAAGGARTLLIQGDPHAEPFYSKAGARRIGSAPSASIPGRSLPLFALDLAAA